MVSDLCPCGSKLPYADCCGRFHAGAPAPTAEALMRSRYCAYARRLQDYLLATWHPDTRPQQLFLHDDAAKWLGLKIVRSQGGANGDAQGTVEFVARYKIGGRAHRLHETSRFVHEGGRWFYVDGVIS